MSIFSNIGSKLSEIFLPSEKVAAERRLKAFGSESKGKAAAIIVGTGAAAIAAPILIGSAAARTALASAASKTATSLGSAAKATGSMIGQSFVKAPIQTSAAVLVGAPLIAGVIASDPQIVTEIPKKSFQTGASLIETIKEHPIGTAILGSVAGGVAAYEGYKALTDEGIIKEETKEKILNSSEEALPVSQSGNKGISSAVPITPETQIIGKAAKSVSIRKKKKKGGFLEGNRQTMRVNIFNSTKNYNKALA